MRMRMRVRRRMGRRMRMRMRVRRWMGRRMRMRMRVRRRMGRRMRMRMRMRMRRRMGRRMRVRVRVRVRRRMGPRRRMRVGPRMWRRMRIKLWMSTQRLPCCPGEGDQVEILPCPSLNRVHRVGTRSSNKLRWLAVPDDIRLVKWGSGRADAATVYRYPHIGPDVA